MNHTTFAAGFVAALAQSAICTPHSEFLPAGDPEFKAVEKEIKVNWLTAKG